MGVGVERGERGAPACFSNHCGSFLSTCCHKFSTMLTCSGLAMNLDTYGCSLQSGLQGCSLGTAWVQPGCMGCSGVTRRLPPARFSTGASAGPGLGPRPPSRPCCHRQSGPRGGKEGGGAGGKEGVGRAGPETWGGSGAAHKSAPRCKHVCTAPICAAADTMSTGTLSPRAIRTCKHAVGMGVGALGVRSGDGSPQEENGF